MGNLIRNAWFGSPFRVLADHPEFPRKHWLQVDITTRKKRIKRFPPRSKAILPESDLKYEGPETSDFAALRTEQLRWEAIQKEYRELDALFRRVREDGILTKWPMHLSAYVSPETIQLWTREVTLLSGTELRLAAERMRHQCKRIIQQRHRSRLEAVLFAIDWSLRPGELKQWFGEWLKINRVHEPRPRTGGSPPKAKEMLRALGAKRLLEFFRAHQKSLPQPYRSQKLHDALRDFTRDVRKASARPEVPLYEHPSGWIEGEENARNWLERL